MVYRIDEQIILRLKWKYTRELQCDYSERRMSTTGKANCTGGRFTEHHQFG
jgi:hypothetical protein